MDWRVLLWKMPTHGARIALIFPHAEPAQHYTTGLQRSVFPLDTPHVYNGVYTCKQLLCSCTQRETSTYSMFPSHIHIEHAEIRASAPPPPTPSPYPVRSLPTLPSHPPPSLPLSPFLTHFLVAAGRGKGSRIRDSSPRSGAWRADGEEESGSIALMTTEHHQVGTGVIQTVAVILPRPALPCHAQHCMVP